MKRNIFKTNSTHKTTMDIGVLYPFQFLDVMRGQTTILSNSAMFRFQPLLAPAMTQMNAHIVSFYVPYRLVLENWNEFISGQEATPLPLTKIKFFGNAPFELNDPFKGTLLEYVGVPPLQVRGNRDTPFELYFPYLWFAAYYKIWSDHFRDPDLQEELTEPKLTLRYLTGLEISLPSNDLSRIQKLYGLKRVNWGKDRFTKALLETQSDPDILLPVGSNGPLQFVTTRPGDGKVSPYIKSDGQGTMAITHRNSPAPWPSDNGSPVASDLPLLYAGGLSGVDMTDFKLASAIYNFKIAQNKYGTRIEDYFRKYGIRDMDTRLKQSELIGGFAETMQISDIISTGDQDLGKQAGHVKGFARRRKLKHYAPEDGVIISMCYIRPKAEYVGGIPRFLLKRDMLDFYQKEFEHVGYQPIYKVEIGNKWLNASLPRDEDELQIFGYENRYAEYRSEPSVITGELMPGRPLSHWANPRYWAVQPSYNSNFLECNPSNQIWASPNTDKAIVWFDRKVTKKCFLTKNEDQRIKL